MQDQPTEQQSLRLSHLLGLSDLFSSSLDAHGSSLSHSTTLPTLFTTLNKFHTFIEMLSISLLIYSYFCRFIASLLGPYSFLYYLWFIVCEIDPLNLTVE